MPVAAAAAAARVVTHTAAAGAGRINEGRNLRCSKKRFDTTEPASERASDGSRAKYLFNAGIDTRNAFDDNEKGGGGRGESSRGDSDSVPHARPLAVGRNGSEKTKLFRLSRITNSDHCRRIGESSGFFPLRPFRFSERVGTAAGWSEGTNRLDLAILTGDPMLVQ